MLKAAPPCSLPPSPLPSPSLRFQYNFQLTSMSIEQVGQPDCWPITGNHSAPQLSPGGYGGEGPREQASSLQSGKGLKAGSLQQKLPSSPHPAGSVGKGWIGRLLGTLQPQAVPQHYIELWIQPFCGEIGAPSCRETQRLKARENGSRGDVCASRSLPGDGRNKNKKPRKARMRPLYPREY